jgi:hypothetical protein
MLHEASEAERVVLIVLLTATLASSVVALLAIAKRWYQAVGRAVIVGVKQFEAPSAPNTATAPRPPHSDEKQGLLRGNSSDTSGVYVSLPPPSIEMVSATPEV